MRDFAYFAFKKKIRCATLAEVMKNALKNTALVLCSILLSLAGMEIVSRLVMPVQYGHTFLAQDGGAVSPVRDFYTLTPGLSYRQVTHEYDKATTHTGGGFRGPMNPAQPDIIFLGDSFTYGTGLADDETIPFIYCGETRQACVNLGRAGTATLHQADILDYFLRNANWQPREVKLMMMVMSAALMAGNDLNGNLEEQARKENGFKPVPETAGKGALQKLVAQRKKILAHSNLARIAYYMAGPALRASFSPGADEVKLAQALAATKMQLARLHEMAQQRNFKLTIYIIHPMQDLMNDTYRDTESVIKGIAPAGVPVIDTAYALVGTSKKPQDYYYPVDGHLNPEGAMRVAKFMAESGF